MKTVITFIVLIFSLVINAQKEFTLSLNGKISNAPNSTLLVFQSPEEDESGEMEIFAEIKVKKNGKFKSKITLPNMDYYKLGFTKDDYFVLVIDGDEKIELIANAEDWSNDYIVKGSTSTDKYNSFSIEFDKIYAIGDSVNKEYQANPEALEEILVFYRVEIDKFYDKAVLFVSENKGSNALFSVLEVFDLEDEDERVLYKQILFDLNDNFKESELIKQKVVDYHQFMEEFEAKEALKIKGGDVALEISLPNPDGKILNLSDYKGQIVLLDFWASWCSPCRVENPNVVALYEKYKDKGFTVFSVSFDMDEESWLKAIEKDGLVWDSHVSDLKGWQSEAGQTYKINAIPTTFLIDENGTIIARDLRGEKLAKKLSELFD